MNSSASCLSYVAAREWFAAGAFALATMVTLVLHNVPALQSNVLYEVHFHLLFIYLFILISGNYNFILIRK